MIHYRLDDLDRLQRIFNPAIVRKAHASTVQKTTRKGRTKVSKEVRGIYRFKAAEISKSSAILKGDESTDGIASRILLYTGGRPSLIKFKHGKGFRRVKSRRGSRFQARVKERKNASPRSVKDGFIGRAKGGGEQIFQRVKGSRMSSNPKKEKLRKLSGPAIPQSIKNLGVVKSLNEFVAQEMPKQFDQEMDFFMTKALGRK